MTLSIPPSVIFEEVGGEAVLLQLDSGTYFRLNHSAARVWTLLGQGVSTPDSLAERLTAEFEVDLATAAADVQRLTSELVRAGLLVDA